MSRPDLSSTERPQVVIVGGGFAGLAAARRLKGTAVQVTLIDRTNHHLFQPLLYQVATGALSPANIAAPLRGILRRQGNVRVLLSEVRDVDVERRRVLTDTAALAYDVLIVATGVRHLWGTKIRSRTENRRFREPALPSGRPNPREAAGAAENESVGLPPRLGRRVAVMRPTHRSSGLLIRRSGVRIPEGPPHQRRWPGFSRRYVDPQRQRGARQRSFGPRSLGPSPQRRRSG